jgi:hypothetical protein
MTSTKAARVRRLENALWGLFAGDALAMPAHWYYNIGHIRRDFDGGVQGYEAARHPHPESFMTGMAYEPDVENAKRLGRPYDILHEHACFYKTTYSRLEIDTPERETEHGHLTPSLKDRYHYHHGLRAGQNTLGAGLARVLMRSVLRSGRYSQRAFLDDFIAYMTTPGANPDPYTEIYLRRWFESYSKGLPPRSCAWQQRDLWSISGHGGVVRPLILAMAAGSAYQGLGVAVTHMALTHRSETVASALGVLAPLAHEILEGAGAMQAMARHAGAIRLPRITGRELFAAYRAHGGPDNIDRELMWRMHNELQDEPFDLERFAREHPDVESATATLATACYPEHGLPLMLYLAHTSGAVLDRTLLANANAGGDNAHRGMILGLLLGAACEEVPAWFLEGLHDRDALEGEIKAFAELAAGGKVC